MMRFVNSLTLSRRRAPPVGHAGLYLETYVPTGGSLTVRTFLATKSLRLQEMPWYCSYGCRKGLLLSVHCGLEIRLF